MVDREFTAGEERLIEEFELDCDLVLGARFDTHQVQRRDSYFIATTTRSQGVKNVQFSPVVDTRKQLGKTPGRVKPEEKDREVLRQLNIGYSMKTDPHAVRGTTPTRRTPSLREPR